MKKRLLSAILAICILFGSVPLLPEESMQVEASALSDAQAKKKKLEQQLADAQKKLADQKKEYNNATSEVDRLKAELAVQEAEKEALTAELLTLYADTEAIIAAFKDAEDAYKKAEEVFKEKSRIMYIYSTQSPLEILAGSDGLSDFFKRIQLILYLAEEDNKLLEELKAAKQDFEYKKQYQEECQEIINEMIANADLAIDNMTLTKAELEEKIKTAKTLLAEEEKNTASLKEDLNAVKNEINKLQGNNNNNAGSGVYNGVFKWPVPVTTRISSDYGTRKDPFTGEKVTHSGIDIPAAKGSSIVAAADGTVTMATTNGGFGLCVKIDHGDGLLTLYGHCSKLLVKKGQKVKKGDLIAQVGTTGRSTGNHLHFEVRINNKHTSPWPYLKGKK